MSVLLRLLKIKRVGLKYRLDQFVPSHKRPWWLKLLWLPLALLPKSQHSRGQSLRLALEELGPIYIKFGQLLSTRPDLVPADIVAELDHLQDNVKPFDKDEFRRIVETALGQSVDTLFQSFDIEPLASASVAQVHAAQLHSGEEVVVKVVRPGIETTIQQDVQLMLWMAKWLERILADGKRLKPVEIVEDYRLTIFDELNLQREAANASQLRRNFSQSPLLYIPEVYWDYTRTNVMVMERIYGIPVTDIAQLEAQQTDMKLLAERGVEIFFSQVFDDNFFHADMHPGNIFVSRNNPQKPQYIAVDMAIVGSLTQEDQYYLARNLLSMFRRDYRQVAELHIQSGWVPKTTRINEFESAIRCVCEPIFEKPLKDISFGQMVINLFQTAQRFNMEVQPQLVLLQKTLLNIEGLGRQLYPELDLWQTAHPYLEKWIKNRYCPTTLLKEATRFGPELLEQLPQLPNKVFTALQQGEKLGEAMPHLMALAEQMNQRQQNKRRTQVQAGLAIAAAVGAFALAAPQISASVSLGSIAFGVLALGLWLTK